MNNTEECDFCENMESIDNLGKNCFLVDIGRGSHRVYNACNICAKALRNISTDWAHVFTDDEMATLQTN